MAIKQNFCSGDVISINKITFDLQSVSHIFKLTKRGDYFLVTFVQF